MQHVCVCCGNPFDVTHEDIALLKKLTPIIAGRTFALPTPTHCPTCRQQRRFAVRNERKIHWRTSEFSGKKILSLYSPDKPYRVYQEDEWWGDEWDPMEHGRNFDFIRPFFEQFNELLHDVPRRGMNQDSSNENCEYTTYGINNKNCYLTFGCAMCEDVYHSSWTYMAKDCVDCLMSGEGELMYECVDCKRCYHCFDCHDCTGCNDTYLSEDCRNCKCCICCKNLRGKEYHIYNKPVSKQMYNAFMQKLFTKGFTEEMEKFHEWKQQFPYCYAHTHQSENSEGDYLEGTKNCFDCYDIVKGAEDCRHSQLGGLQCRDVMDCSMMGMSSQLLYEVNNSMSCTNCAFLNFCKECNDCYYCDTVRSAAHCFGCIGLRHKKYCIFNKQYTQEEYKALASRIIEHMQNTREWGEYFPISISPFTYNETVAQDFYPLSKEQALGRGYTWKSETDEVTYVEKIIPATKLPKNINDIPDDVLNWAIKCEVTGRPFRIIKQELHFYRKEGLPIPHLHPEERHRRRVILRNPRKLWNRKCDQCKKQLYTTYAPERPEIIYCGECYLNAVHGTVETESKTLVTVLK